MLMHDYSGIGDTIMTGGQRARRLKEDSMRYMTACLIALALCACPQSADWDTVEKTGPGAMYLVLDSAEDLAVLDAALLAAGTVGDDETDARRIMVYVHAQLGWDFNSYGWPTKDADKQAYGHTGTYALSLTSGSCYWQSVAFVALCRRSQIPARRINLWGCGYGSHTVAEAWWDDAWHLMDTYWCDAFVDDSGDELSLDAIRAGTSPITCMHALATEWEYYGIDWCVGDQLDILMSPVIAIPEVPATFPLTLDMASGSDAHGADDNDMFDCAGCTEYGQVFHYLGDWRGVAEHNVTMLNASGQYIVITYDIKTNAASAVPTISNAVDALVFHVDLDATTLTLHAYCTSDAAAFTMSLNGGYIVFDAVSAEVDATKLDASGNP